MEQDNLSKKRRLSEEQEEKEPAIVLPVTDNTRSLTLDMSKYRPAIQKLSDSQLIEIFEIGVAVKQSFTLTVSENSEFVKNEFEKQMQPILKKIDGIQTQVKDDVSQIQHDVSKQAATQKTNFTDETTLLKKSVAEIQNNVHTQMSKFTSEVTSLKTGVEDRLYTIKNVLVGEVQGVCGKVEPIRELEDRVTRTITSSEEKITQKIIVKIDEYKDELRKLTEQMQKPAIKGSIGENTVIKFLQQNFPSYTVNDDVAKQPGKGDIHIKTPNGHHFLVEVKDYTDSVPKRERDKFKIDVASNHEVKVGLMLSLNSGISTKAKEGKFQVDVDNEKFLIYVPNAWRQKEIMVWCVLLANELAGMKAALKDGQAEKLQKLCETFQQRAQEVQKCREKMTILEKAMEDLKSSMEPILKVIEDARKEIDGILKKA